MMKKLLALALVALMAGGALAQSSEENMMGMFFTNDLAAIDANMGEMPHPDTNFPHTFAPFFGYIVLLYPTVDSVAAYEVGISISDPTVFLLNVSGPNGWTNFGSPTNHIAGFATPVPCTDVGAVLQTINMLYTGTGMVTIAFGAADPSSFGGEGPGVADGANPENLILCPLTSDVGYVATINGDGVVATEEHSYSAVKALFD